MPPVATSARRRRASTGQRSESVPMHCRKAGPRFSRASARGASSGSSEPRWARTLRLKPASTLAPASPASRSSRGSQSADSRVAPVRRRRAPRTTARRAASTSTAASRRTSCCPAKRSMAGAISVEPGLARAEAVAGAAAQGREHQPRQHQGVGAAARPPVGLHQPSRRLRVQGRSGEIRQSLCGVAAALAPGDRRGLEGDRGLVGGDPLQDAALQVRRRLHPHVVDHAGGLEVRGHGHEAPLAEVHQLSRGLDALWLALHHPHREGAGVEGMSADRQVHSPSLGAPLGPG